MKKPRLLIAIGLILLVIFSVGIYLGLNYYNSGTKPLENLNIDDVTLPYAYKYRQGHYKILDILMYTNALKSVEKHDDIEKVINELKSVVVYDKVKLDSLEGEPVYYELGMSGGKGNRIVIISGKFIVIDGVCYKAKEKTTRRLIELYDKLNYKVHVTR